MKKVFFSAGVLLMLSTASFAQDAAVSSEVTILTPADKGDDKKKITATELPDAVQKTLASDAYKEWQLVTAWHVTGKDEHYVLEMRKGEEKSTLKMNKEGQII